MTPPQRLQVELLSDTIIGRGEGAAGGVDVEVVHDSWGLPFIPGSMLLGLIRDVWLSMAPVFPNLAEAGGQLFGPDADRLRVGDAVLPADLQSWVRFAVQRRDNPLTPDQVLRTLTDLRYQARRERVGSEGGAIKSRTSRVVLRGLRFVAPLTWTVVPSPVHIQVLAMGSLGVRHVGQGRSRGRGHVAISLDGDTDATSRFALGTGEAV